MNYSPQVLAVFPISHVDANLALGLAKRITELGGCPNHRALIVSTARARGYLSSIQAELEKSFSKVETFLPVRQHEEGWPSSSNHMFKQAAIYVAELTDYDGPWYFIEADSTPIKPQWLDLLNGEYLSSGKPFMGVIHDTIVVDYNSTPGNIIRKVDGQHMVGTGIYPKNAAATIPLFQYIDDGTIQRLPPSLPALPWDCLIQGYTVPRCRHTALIQHDWKANNFRQDASGVVVHDQVQPFGVNNPLRADAVIHHGCKDGSLLRLLTEPVKVAAKSVSLPPPISVAAPAIPPRNGTVSLAELRKARRMERLKRRKALAKNS